MSEEKKKLLENEIDQLNGGYKNGTTSYNYNDHKYIIGGQVNKYHIKQGNMYFYKLRNRLWLCRALRNNYEKDNGFGTTVTEVDLIDVYSGATDSVSANHIYEAIQIG